ncbi:MAG: HAD family phosphatase [Eggerthellaceae bacterium]|nr:HAD family phosphatase [Eggerthellaceae bacterium]
MGVWRALEDDLAARGGFTLTKDDTDHITTLTIPECGDFFHEKFGLGSSGAEVKGMIDEFMMDFYAHRAEGRPGALAFVRALAERGVPQSVASSTPKPLLEAGLAHAGFTPYLADIVSVDDVGASKREPAVYDRARRALGTPRERTWGFEDAVYAVRTLAAAGYGTVGVYDNDLAGTYDELAAEADMVIRDFRQLSPDEFLVLAAARL